MYVYNKCKWTELFIVTLQFKSNISPLKNLILQTFIFNITVYVFELVHFSGHVYTLHGAIFYE